MDEESRAQWGGGTLPPAAFASSMNVPLTLPPQSITPTMPPNSMGFGTLPPSMMAAQFPMSTPGTPFGTQSFAGTRTVLPGSMAMPPTLPPTASGVYSSTPIERPPTSPPTASRDYGAIPPSMASRRFEQSKKPERVEGKPPSDMEDLRKWHNVRHFIAYMFTLTAFTILAAPTIILIQLGMDVDASYWIGRWGLIALGVPIFLVGQHFYHLWMLGNPSSRRRYIFFIVPCLPAVLFMIVGGVYFSYAKSLYGQLKSTDCSANSPTPAKFWMQDAYDKAHVAYDQCLVRLEKENLGQPLRRHPNLQSCTEWDDLLENTKGLVPWKGYKISPNTLRQHNPSNDQRWQYLADIEVNHLCGGFCTVGPALFVSYGSTGRVGGSCAQFVAFRFLSIAHWGFVVFMIGLLILVLSLSTYLFSRTFLASMGYKSAVTLG